MSAPHRLIRLTILILLVLFWSRTAPAAPRVVVSIKPLHGLAAGVMAGVGQPDLLLGSGGSPHGHSLRPSQALMLRQAQVVFWVGPGLEEFLVKPLDHLAGQAQVVALAGVPGVTAVREEDSNHHGGEGKNHHGEGEDEEEEGHHHHSGDPHVWLDPVNAQAMVTAMATTLSAVDPANAARYRDNGTRLDQRLADLTARLQARLAPIRKRPFVVFHDAYGYFTRRFGLDRGLALTLSPEHKPSAQRLMTVRQRILADGIHCVFAEPQFKPDLLAAVTRDLPVHQGILDEVGATLAPGEEAYFSLLENLAAALLACPAGQ
ncbi:MAG: zinc ABC transporter substrate-binding protein [Magnetococcales bacterium]|nr:zinc ABC transporter substrate-binding protein [Magnetococcales bacterium]